MNWSLIIKVQGYLLLILGIMMFFPLMISFYYNGDDLNAIIFSIIITLATGLIFIFIFKSNKKFKSKEGFASVSLGWILAAFFGGLPYFFHGSFGPYINCVFEAMSGFTTTGSTILTDIESIPRGLLFWRSLTHWLGGMGIVLFTIAILPMFGIAPGQLYNAEVPGPTKDRLSPKIKDTAKILWLIYIGLTIIETIFLMFGGMDLYTAINHSFATVATGGFSTLNNSVSGFNSVYIDIVITIFMFLAGVNFALYFYLIKGRFRDFFKDSELRFYTAVVTITTILISLNIYFSSGIEKYTSNYGRALLDSAFQVVSITTTTGFMTADFNLWPPFSALLLVTLMFFGGCAGSTGGGMKQIRILILFKHLYNEIKKLAHPRAFFALRIGEEHVENNVVRNVLGFSILFMVIFTGSTLFLAGMGYDIITSFTAAISCLGNIGPGLARVGAIENFGFFDPYSKGVLIFCMLLGRLEIYSVLILIYSIIFRKR